MRQALASVLLLLGASAAIAQTGTRPADSGEEDIIVRARPLAELDADWRACLTNGCPPREEMTRALSLMEAQVRAGDYHGGWTTARTAKRRNLRYANDLPVPVGQVVRAAARLADLNGEPTVSRVGMIDTVDALKKGLPSADDRVLLARLDIGDAFVGEFRFEDALDQYRRVGSAARKQGNATLAAAARYRGAALMAGLADVRREYRADARSELKAIAASDEPALAPYRNLAKLLSLNLLSEKKQAAAVDALLPGLTPVSPSRPVLAYAPPIDWEREPAGVSALTQQMSDSGRAQEWADLSFRITRDGRVADVAALRQSPHLDESWLAVATRAFNQRRYVPIALAADDPGPTRVARLTFVRDSSSETRSRVNSRSNLPRLDVIDLGPVTQRLD